MTESNYLPENNKQPTLSEQTAEILENIVEHNGDIEGNFGALALVLNVAISRGILHGTDTQQYEMLDNLQDVVFGTRLKSPRERNRLMGIHDIYSNAVELLPPKLEQHEVGILTLVDESRSEPVPIERIDQELLEKLASAGLMVVRLSRFVEITPKGKAAIEAYLRHQSRFPELEE